jgi:penicillin-binding protein 1A
MRSMQKPKKFFNKIRTRWIIVIIIISLLFGIGVGTYIAIVSDLPPAESISLFTPPVSTKVFDDKDSLITEFFIERRELTNIEEVPEYLKQGLLCIEDKNFYKHWGVDLSAIFRSLITNIFHMSIVQGASTITMQLARNMFLTQEVTLLRKLKEAALAVRIERAYTKDEILEKYLNQIPFGQGRYGVATAAKYYFNKDISELSLTECALLIAIPKGPEVYSPHKYPERTKARRDFVLKKMAESAIISDEVYEAAIEESLHVADQKSEKRIGEYFIEEIRRYIELKYGVEFLYRSGTRIYTTMNTEIQKKAEEVLEKHLVEIEESKKLPNAKALYDSIGVSDTLTASPYLQGALVFLDYHTGDVKALIGGRDFSQSKFNRATQAQRQAGSAFKVFVFATAIDNGFTPSDIILDLPIVLEIPGVDSIYRPSNYDRKFLGPITLRKALALSRNLAAIRLIRNLGPELVVEYAHNLGVRSPLLPVVSLALGTCEVSLLELTNAFGTIANLGEEVQPRLIRKITDKDNTVIEVNNTIPERKLSPQTSYIMINLMRAVVDEGTAHRVRSYYQGPAAGKTGTTNNYSDAWYVGFTPEYICGVWVGYDNNDRIYEDAATGGAISTPIWGDLMARVDTLHEEEFPIPPGLVWRKICPESGLLAREYCPNPKNDVFVEGNEPQDSCHIHGFRERVEYREDFEIIDRSSMEDF